MYKIREETNDLMDRRVVGEGAIYKEMYRVAIHGVRER